jgi:hypothetical protein
MIYWARYFLASVSENNHRQLNPTTLARFRTQLRLIFGSFEGVIANLEFRAIIANED